MVLLVSSIFSKGGIKMHKLAKEIMDRVKSKINSSGIDGITEQELVEMKYWTAVADNMTSYDYHFKILEEMEKPENQYGVNYDENGRFYTQPRNEMGQFARRPYMYEPGMEQYRDMDVSRGRMYYTDSNNVGGMSNRSAYNSRENQESRYDRARRGYEEAKQMNPDTDNMREIEQLFDAFEYDIKELKPNMTQNERTVARNKLTNVMNAMM